MFANLNNQKLAIVLGSGIAMVSLIIFFDNYSKKTKPKPQVQAPISDEQIRAELEKLVFSLLQQSSIDPFYRIKPELSKLNTKELVEFKLAMQTINKYKGERDVMKYAPGALTSVQYLISKAK